jgi:hypothetical protein
MSWWTGASHGTRVGRYIYDSTIGAWKKFTSDPIPGSAALTNNVLLSWNNVSERVQGLGVAATSGVDTPSGTDRINIHGHVHAAKIVAPVVEGSLAGDITGNAATASKLQAGRSIEITGAVTGSVVFDGSSNVSITTTTNHSHTWSAITDKPSTYPPSVHTHPWSNVTEIPATASRWPAWSEVTSKPSTFTPEAHNHDASYYTKAQADGRFVAVTSGTSFPGSPTFGDEIYRTDLDEWYKYNGAVWTQI